MPRRFPIECFAAGLCLTAAAISFPVSVLALAAGALSGPAAASSRPTPPPTSAAARFELVSRSLFQGPARGAAFFDGGVVLAAGGAVAVVPDGSDPRDAHIVHLDGVPHGLAAGGGRVWIAARGHGLVAIDLGEAGAAATTLVHAGAQVHALAISQRWLLLADDHAGLILFDIGAPLSPRRADTRGPAGTGMLLAAGPGLFAAAAGDSIELLLVNAAGKLERAGSVRAGSALRRCLFAGPLLLALGGDGTVRRWDAAEPRAPRALGPLPERNVQDIAFDGERILVLRRDGVIVPFSAAGNGDLAGGGAEDGGSDSGASGSSGARETLSLRHALSRRAGVAGSSRFTGSALAARRGNLIVYGGEGFRFFDLSGAEARPAGARETAGFAIDVRARDGYVYLANGRGGLHIGRLEGDGTVAWTERLPVADARGIAFAGDLLVIAAGNGGASFYRLEKPGKPVLLGRHESPFYLSAVVTTGALACFAGGLGGAETVDFSSPSAPRLVWRERLSEVRGLDTDGRHLYVCDGFEGFKVYSLGPGGRPALLAALDTPGWNCGAYLSGSILYLAEGGEGFLAADVSDPAAPVLLGAAKVGAISRAVYARGTTVFVAAQMGGIAAIDASDPRRPAVAARYQTVGDARGVFADERFVYLAGGSGGLYIFRYHQ